MSDGIDELEELKREIEERIARLEKLHNSLDQRARFNQIALVNAVERINAKALQKGTEDAKLITGLAEAPQS